MIKTVIHNQDNFLVTPRNIAVFKSKLAASGAVVNSFTQYPDRIELELSGTVTQDTVSWCANFWEGSLWGTQEPDYKVAALKLYTLLDDIDTLDDLCRDDPEMFRTLAMREVKKRFDIASTDGYSVTFSTPEPHYCKGGCTCQH